MIGAAPLAAFSTIDKWIREGRLVTGIAPDETVHEDRRIETFHIVTIIDNRSPPGTHDVVLQLNTERTVIPGRPDSAVDLRVRKNEATSLAQADDLFHARSRHNR